MGKKDPTDLNYLNLMGSAKPRKNRGTQEMTEIERWRLRADEMFLEDNLGLKPRLAFPADFP
jgi:hypothetical protein